MIRGNLATRPFYNERPVRLVVGILVLLVALATLFNVTEALRSARRDSALETTAAQDEARARELSATADALRAGVRVDALRADTDRAHQANDLIDRRTFSWTALFNRLEATLPENVRITSIRPQLDQTRGIVLTITLMARGVDDVDTFMEQLDATGAFKDLLPRTERVNEQGLLEVALETVYEPAHAVAAAAARETAR
jgi:Tfp pilus assembly protein PilN